jgi:hypothetical protein
VALPRKGQSRLRWLTRSEAAKLLWVCWRAREVQTVHRGPCKGQKIETDTRPLRHLARFILLGLYTGTGDRRGRIPGRQDRWRSPRHDQIDVDPSQFGCKLPETAAVDRRGTCDISA